MPAKVRFIDNRTILDKVGASNRVVDSWKRKGLKITFPTKQNQTFFKSDDGEAFIENADKFVPKLSPKEIKLYRNYPEKFEKDFLRNAKFYVKFLKYIDKISERTKSLRGKEKMLAVISLLYIFQRAMDYNYFHWDRYLVYQNYPDTPVGYWWSILTKLYKKAAGIKFPNERPPEEFLKLLSLDKKVLAKMKSGLNKKDFASIRKSLGVVKKFEEIQEKEVRVVIDMKNKEEIFFRTAIPLWNSFCKEVSKRPKFIRSYLRIKSITEMHPIIGIRKLMLLENLECFDKDFNREFRREISRWCH